MNCCQRSQTKIPREITLAMIQAKKQRKRFTFEELVELDREDRLGEKLRQ